MLRIGAALTLLPRTRRVDRERAPRSTDAAAGASAGANHSTGPELTIGRRPGAALVWGCRLGAPLAASNTHSAAQHVGPSSFVAARPTVINEERSEWHPWGRRRAAIWDGYPTGNTLTRHLWLVTSLACTKVSAPPRGVLAFAVASVAAGSTVSTRRAVRCRSGVGRGGPEIRACRAVRHVPRRPRGEVLGREAAGRVRASPSCRPVRRADPG